MTRLEELTLKSADDCLGSEERDELDAILSSDGENRDAYLELLKIEALLRARSPNPDFGPSTLEQIRREITETVETRVMQNVQSSATIERRILQSSFRKSVYSPAYLPLAASLTLLAALFIWYFSARMGSPVIAQLTGSATIERAGQSLPIKPGTALQPGDFLRTADGTSRVSITYAPEKTTITLWPSTDLRLLSGSSGKRFFLATGKLEATVAHQRPFHPMLIRTHQAEARVLGTRLTLTSTTDLTRLDVIEGKVRLTQATNEVDVPGGYYASAGKAIELRKPLPQTGTILYQYWTNVTGTFIPEWDTTVAENPHGTAYLTLLEAPITSQDNLGQRIRGYIHPPKTGDYTFWVAGDGGVKFMLSRDDRPENRVWLATADRTRKNPREWTNQSKQKSDPLTLTAGRNYYVEVIQYDGGKGEHHLAVAWQGPDREQEVIPGEFLSPFELKKNRKNAP